MCRTARAKRELLRVVRTPDGRVVLDSTGRLAGRGAYLCAVGPCRDQAVTKGALQRALKTPVPPEALVALGVADVSPTTSQGGARGQE